MKRKKWCLAVIVMVFALALICGSAVAADKVIKWKGQGCFGNASPLGKYTSSSGSNTPRR